MSDYEPEPITRKRHQFRKLALARERVKQLERELCGEPVKPEDPPFVPPFLRGQVGNGPTKSFDSAVPLVGAEAASLVTRALNSWRPLRPIRGLPAPFGARTLSGVYCETCNEETLHVRGVCNHCATRPNSSETAVRTGTRGRESKVESPWRSDHDATRKIRMNGLNED
jgi:hypothetical protein